MGKRGKLASSSRNRWKALATYLATFLSNLAVVGVGLGFFQNMEGTYQSSALALALGVFIIWMVEK